MKCTHSIRAWYAPNKGWKKCHWQNNRNRSTIRIFSIQCRCACSWHQRHQRSQVLTTIDEPRNHAHLSKTQHQVYTMYTLYLYCKQACINSKPESTIQTHRNKHNTLGVARTVFMGVYKSDVTHAVYTCSVATTSPINVLAARPNTLKRGSRLVGTGEHENQLHQPPHIHTSKRPNSVE